MLDQITPFDGVEEALRELKSRGVRLAVLSGLRLEAIESILSTLTFRDWDAVRSSMMYPTESGDSRALGIMSLVEEFGVAPGRTIYIGDTDHDVRQARRAGVVSAVVKTGGQAVKHLDRIQAQKPDHLLAAWPDLRRRGLIAKRLWSCRVVSPRVNWVPWLRLVAMFASVREEHAYEA